MEILQKQTHILQPPFSLIGIQDNPEKEEEKAVG